MIEPLLEEIYYSNCGQMEKLHVGKEYERLKKEAGEYYEKIFEILNKEQREWLEKYWLASAGQEAEWGYANFREGIKFGAQLILEILEERIFHQNSEKQKNNPPD